MEILKVMDPACVRMLLGVFGLLSVATGVGAVLAHRVKGEAGRVTVTNLNARIGAWWVMAVVFTGAMALGRGGMTFLFALLSFLALREFITLTPTRRADHRALFSGFFVVTPVQYLAVWMGSERLFELWIPVCAFLLVPLRSAVVGDCAGFLERAAKIQWALMVCVYCLSHVPMLLTLSLPGHRDGSMTLLLYLVLVVELSDVFQYAWGKVMGRHPMAPTVSPSKTWEGLVGGVMTATLLGAALWWATPFRWWESGLLSMEICFMGFAGGLVMSAIKRDRGVKDYGSLIHGHGGVMDRLDSLSFAAPLFYHMVRQGWVG